MKFILLMKYLYLMLGGLVWLVPSPLSEIRLVHFSGKLELVIVASLNGLNS